MPYVLAPSLAPLPSLTPHPSAPLVRRTTPSSPAPLTALAGFALGATWVRCAFSRFRHILLGCLFACATPVGVFAGDLVVRSLGGCGNGTSSTGGANGTTTNGTHNGTSSPPSPGAGGLNNRVGAAVALQAIKGAAAGTFLYVALVEILARELKHDDHESGGGGGGGGHGHGRVEGVGGDGSDGSGDDEGMEGVEGENEEGEEGGEGKVGGQQHGRVGSFGISVAEEECSLGSPLCDASLRLAKIQQCNESWAMRFKEHGSTDTELARSARLFLFVVGFGLMSSLAVWL